MSDDAKVTIPGKAVSADEDLLNPLRAVLEDLNLLGKAEQLENADGFASAFKGPPQSVALIQAGITAATKWWAAGLGGAVAAAWASVANWWPDQQVSVQIAVIAAASVITAAAVLAIGNLIASDVRGRAAVSVALVDGRSRVAQTIIESAASAQPPSPVSAGPDIESLPGLAVKNHGRPATDEDGWMAVALEREADGEIKYVVVKGSVETRASASELEFVTKGRR